MWRFLVMGSVLGCKDGGGASDPRETDLPADTDGFVGCDYTAFAGDWAGEVTQDGFPPYDFVLAVTGRTAVDERFGVGHYATRDAVPIECEVAFTCTGREENDWAVATERVVSGPCTDGYAFFRLEEGETLACESSMSEFGSRTARAELHRLP